MNFILKSVFIGLFMSILAQGYCQQLDNICTEKIKQRKIREYIKRQIKAGKHQFSDIRPSWNKTTIISDYNSKQMSFVLNGNCQKIWNGYIHSEISQTWNGRKITLGLLLQKSPSAIYYYRDTLSGLDTGQVYFLNLSLVGHLLNVPVAFEIITIDNNKRVIEFSYIEGNKSKGLQQLQFIDVDSSQTRIIHTSYFKSNSHFRDKWIYPFFHQQLLNEFHRNMEQTLKTTEK